MYKYILEGAGSINWMAIFALLTFFFIFMIGGITVFLTRSEHINHMANLPLDAIPETSDSSPSA
ncbi:MAG: CcoQ/FixQ family Cbb3-type cytochrome c oxidase assembly chaperone [Saprospiraceae bacterium]